MIKNNIQTALEIVRELSYILDKRQKRKAFLLLGIIIISSGFEMIGVTAVLPFMQAVITPDVLMEKTYIKSITEILDIKSSEELLLFMGIGLILVYIVKNLYMLFSYYMQCDFSTRLQKELSIRMMNSYMHCPYAFFLDINSAEIMRTCGSDVNGVYCIISYLSVVVAEALSIVLIGLFIIYTDPLIAMGVLLLMLLVFLGIVVFFKPRVKIAGIRNIKASTLKNKAIYQAVTGIKEIFVMQRKECFLKEYEKASEMARKSQRTHDFLSNSPDRIVEGICISGIIGIVCIRLTMSDVDTVTFIPKLGAFAMAAFKILPSIGKIANRMTGIIYQRPALANVYTGMKESNEYFAQAKQYIESHGIDNDTLKDLDFRDTLTINHVLWKYKNQKNPVLTDAVLTVKKGESIAFVGASGAGKTTLADIILGLLRPQQGTIEMDGIDVYSMPEEWARILGYVPQAVFLMDDTVRANIAFGLQDIDDEKIWDALKRAQLKKFIESLPDGLDTIVGERGIKFSGGQKQRVAIARALYNRPEILILDEATAALDNETEAAVMESIDALQGQITMIIVAHRLTTIRNCDRIYEIGGGIVTEVDKDEILKEI